MKSEELIQMLMNEECMIMCSSIEQKADVCNLLERMGFTINSFTKNGVEERDLITFKMYPNIAYVVKSDGSGLGLICGASNSYHIANRIHFDQLRNLMREYGILDPDVELNGWKEAEFTEEFLAMLGWGGLNESGNE